jgi:amino acid transporter
MTDTASPAPPIAKGLKLGAIGVASSIAIGVASTAPAYSLAATLGYETQAVGTKAPVVMLIAFVPMLFIAFAYRALNNADPDCGTSFTWVSRTFGPHTGWITGWVIIVADIIVMANLAEIAGRYSCELIGMSDLANNTTAVTAVGCAWILAMTAIAWMGIEISARTQVVLLSLELLVLVVFSAVALSRVYAGTAGGSAMRPSLSWFDPSDLDIKALSAGLLLAVFIYWGWDSAVAVNEETENRRLTPGRAAVVSTFILLSTYLLVTVAVVAFAGAGDEAIGLTNPTTIDDPLNGIGAAVLGGWGSEALVLAILSSAAASMQTTILPTARTTLAMAVYKALPKVFGEVHGRYRTPTVSTWTTGIISVAFYAGLTWLDPGSLNDLIAAVGLLIAFYYGLAGLAAAWWFRRQIGRSAKDLWFKGILPLLGGVIMFAAFIKTAVDSYASDFGETALFGVGGVFLLGVGSILLGIVLMIIWNAMRPEYFRGTAIGDDGQAETTRGRERT